MAANVETMMYVREVPWHGLGVRVEEAPDSKRALILGGLDWKVKSQPAYYMNTQGQILMDEEHKMNVRTTDDMPLGIVGNRYKIVQNEEAFAFTDSLIGGDVHYETCGSLNSGKTVWLLAQLEGRKILDDDFNNYICFTNNHDGTGAVKAFMTPIRVVCNNTLNLAMNQAKRTWSMRHVGDIAGKMAEARQALQMSSNYIERLGVTAEELAVKRITDEKISQWLEEMFPVTEDMSDRSKENKIYCRDSIIKCYNADDIANYKGTAWGFVNAVSDFVGHVSPTRTSNNYQENNWSRIMGGHPLLDEVYKMVKAA